MGSDWDIELSEQRAHDAKMARKDAFPAKVKALVKSAIKLTIARHDLTSDSIDYEDFDDDDMERIAEDVWQAMNGENLCPSHEGEIEESLAAVLDTAKYLC